MLPSKYKAPIAYGTHEPWPPALVGWYVVLVLTCANTVSLIDRQVLSLLVEEIRADWGLNDTQISLLQGAAFVIFYTLAGLPIARLADSRNRKIIIIVGIGIWSAMTAICGLAKSYWYLFLARIGVGVGEASLSPSAYSMVADYFPPNKLAFPLGVFATGIAAGMGLALLAGGYVIDMAIKKGPADWPIVGVLQPWQSVFIVVGMIGIIPVGLMCTIKEPSRRSGDPINTGKHASVPVREMFKFFRTNWRAYATIVGGFTLTAVTAYGILSWTPAFYMRSFGLTASEAGYFIGLVIIASGLIGSFAGGMAADVLERRGVTNGKVVVLLVACGGVIVPGVAAPLMPNVNLALVFLFLSFLFGQAMVGPLTSAIQVITPNRMRAQAGALYLVIVNFFGLTVGPTSVALITDYVFKDPMDLRYSLVIVNGVANVLGFILIALGLKPYRRVVEKISRTPNNKVS